MSTERRRLEHPKMKPTARETTGDPASSGEGNPPPAATLDLLSMIPVVKGCLLIEKNFIQGFPLVIILPLDSWCCKRDPKSLLYLMDEGATFFSKVCLFPANSQNEMLGKWLSDFHLDLWPSIFCYSTKLTPHLRSKRSSPCPRWCQPPNSIDVPGSSQHPKISPQSHSIFTTLKLQTKDWNKIYQKRQVGHLLVAQRGDILAETNVIWKEHVVWKTISLPTMIPCMPLHPIQNRRTKKTRPASPVVT